MTAGSVTIKRLPAEAGRAVWRASRSARAETLCARPPHATRSGRPGDRYRPRSMLVGPDTASASNHHRRTNSVRNNSSAASASPSVVSRSRTAYASPGAATARHLRAWRAARVHAPSPRPRSVVPQRVRRSARARTPPPAPPAAHGPLHRTSRARRATSCAVKARAGGRRSCSASRTAMKSSSSAGCASEAGALNLSECQGDATRIRRARGVRDALPPPQQSGEPQLIEYHRNRECHHEGERTPDDCLLDALRQVYSPNSQRHQPRSCGARRVNSSRSHCLKRDHQPACGGCASCDPGQHGTDPFDVKFTSAPRRAPPRAPKDRAAPTGPALRAGYRACSSRRAAMPPRDWPAGSGVSSGQRAEMRA